MDPFVVNLNEATSSRFLKAGFELEVVDESTVKALENNKRAVRDEVLRYLSGLTVADTLGEDNKAKIGETLVARIDKTLGGHNMVKKMYFSEFMVQ
jgi:flagellar basal body-associated protein FliL